MSYYNDVSLVFRAVDYKNVILPAVLETENGQEILASAETFKYSKKNYGVNAIGIRFRSYNNWDFDEFSSTLEQVRHEVEHDFARFGEDVTDVETHIDLSILELSGGYGFLPCHTYQENYESIILNLAKHMAKQGVSNRDIAKIATGEDGPNHVFCAEKVVKHLLETAKR